MLTDRILGLIVLAGGFTAVAALAVMLVHGGSFVHAAWLAYTTLVVAQCVRAYWNRCLRDPIHRLGRNGFLLVTYLAAVAVQALIPYVPALAEAFHATPIDPGEWLVVALVAFVPALAAELIRWRGRGRVIWVA